MQKKSKEKRLFGEPVPDMRNWKPPKPEKMQREKSYPPKPMRKGMDTWYV